ncbi:amidohydrolase [Thermanaerovibrio velox]|uniref:amidohydrolase n=1 Tax=Thermanaerovibrio velox TaxID=108007 RepID=UPI001FDFB2FA|nr:amidohydrolase [Thermanaerovibrio velox]
MVNARIWTMKEGEGAEISRGAVLIEGGRIVQVGEDVELKGPVEVVDAKGAILTPGLIDAHTHAGICEEGVPEDPDPVNEETSPVTMGLRALDGINPNDEAFSNALEAGVTCVNVVPGSANVIGGSGAVVRTFGRTLDEMLVLPHSGMKAALGENPMRVHGRKDRLPSTRMGNAYCLRKAIQDALNYRQRKLRALEKGEHFDLDLGMENMIPVLEGRCPLRIHCHRADDICTAVRVCREFGVPFTLEHGTEGHLVADLLASLSRDGVSVAVGPTQSSKSKIELRNKTWETLVAFSKAKVRYCIITDHPVIPIETLQVAVALAVRHGLDPLEAMRGVTLRAAEHLGIGHRMGSVEAGKDADLVLWTGDPTDVRHRPLWVMVGGEMAFVNSRA